MERRDAVSIRDYIDSRMKAEERRLDDFLKLITQHFDLNAKAIEKAEEAMLIRLEQMNEFRAQINKERAEYASKEAVVEMWRNIEKRLKPLEESRAFSAGKLWMVMAAFATIPTILAVIAIYMQIAK